MDAELFIENVKTFCRRKGVSPTAACVASGAGRNLLTNLKKGEEPSIKRVQLLADYLECSVSDLVGDIKEPTALKDGEPVHTITFSRNGEVVRKKYSAEHWDTIIKMLDAIPEDRLP